MSPILTRLLLVAGLLSACNSDVGAVNGSVGGKSLSVSDSVVYATGNATAIALIDVSGICAYFSEDTTPKNSTALVIYFQGNVGAGSFSIGTGSNVSADWSRSDAMCTHSLTSASSGTVTITSVSAEAVVGNFDLELGSDHVTGRFNATTCAVITDAGTPPACR